jgi:hypothetical protein
MYSYFSDLHVDLLARAILEPGEQRVGQTVGRYVPWWGLGFINETYLVIATDRRVVLVEHRMAWFHQAVRLHSVDSLPWQGVEEARVKGIFGKKLVLKGRNMSRSWARKLRIPNPLFGLLAPMRGNVTGARAIAQAFQTTRALGAGQAIATLPPTPYAGGQPVPMLPPPALSTPSAAFAPAAHFAPEPGPYAPAPVASLPPQNAPGYASVPPASVQPPSRGVPPLPPRPSVGPRPTY